MNFKKFFFLSLIISTISLAQNKPQQLTCSERYAPTLALSTWFYGPNLIKELVVITLNGRAEVKFNNTIIPRKSSDKTTVETSFNGWHLEYSLGYIGGCSYFFSTPTDVIDYQKQISSLKNEFIANLKSSCKGFNGNKSIDLVCKFK